MHVYNNIESIFAHLESLFIYLILQFFLCIFNLVKGFLHNIVINKIKQTGKRRQNRYHFTFNCRRRLGNQCWLLILYMSIARSNTIALSPFIISLNLCKGSLTIWSLLRDCFLLKSAYVENREVNKDDHKNCLLKKRKIRPKLALSPSNKKLAELYFTISKTMLWGFFFKSPTNWTENNILFIDTIKTLISTQNFMEKTKIASSYIIYKH